MRGISLPDTPFCFFSQDVVELAGITDDLGRPYTLEMATLAWLDHQRHLSLHRPKAHAIGSSLVGLEDGQVLVDRSRRRRLLLRCLGSHLALALPVASHATHTPDSPLPGGLYRLHGQ